MGHGCGREIGHRLEGGYAFVFFGTLVWYVSEFLQATPHTYVQTMRRLLDVAKVLCDASAPVDKGNIHTVNPLQAAASYGCHQLPGRVTMLQHMGFDNEFAEHVNLRSQI